MKIKRFNEVKELTAEEFLNGKVSPFSENNEYSLFDLEDAMIDFTKYHFERLLEEIKRCSNESEIKEKLTEYINKKIK